LDSSCGRGRSGFPVIFCIHFFLYLDIPCGLLRSGFPSSNLYSFVTFCAWIFYVAFCIQVLLVIYIFFHTLNDCGLQV
jgi:hypothetical protein